MPFEFAQCDRGLSSLPRPFLPEFSFKLVCQFKVHWIGTRIKHLIFAGHKVSHRFACLRHAVQLPAAGLPDGLAHPWRRLARCIGMRLAICVNRSLREANRRLLNRSWFTPWLKQGLEPPNLETRATVNARSVDSRAQGSSEQGGGVDAE